MRGLNDFNKTVSKYLLKDKAVSVPMRGLNDFNLDQNITKIREKALVSVPMRGLNDFNERFKKFLIENKQFPSPCGV